MEEEKFRLLLKNEFERRKKKNPSYSLRSYARFLGIYHGTLSLLLSGRRPISAKTVTKLAPKLRISPTPYLKKAKKVAETPKTLYRKVLTEDVFSLISHWYFDAIIEYTRVDDADMSPEAVAKYFGITKGEAHEAIQTLLRLGILLETEDGGLTGVPHSTNVESNEKTSQAMRDYQKRILEKSIRSLDNVPREKRDHTSTTMAVRGQDVGKVKELIRKFSDDLSLFLQDEEKTFDEVYQLQVSFFPLKDVRTK